MRSSRLFAFLFASALAVSACSSAPEPAAEESIDAVAAAEPEGPMVTGDNFATDTGDLVVQPLSHATFAMAWNGSTIYVDPTGGAEMFDGLPAPDLVLITDIHGDHLDADTLAAVVAADTQIIAPAAVIEQLSEAAAAQASPLANGEETSVLGLTVEAVPMYNLTEDRLGYHEMGRGNGYVVTMGGQRVYISGDTEDIPEMRALENIDVAFVCFNLPFTMTEDQAASAVAEFAPTVMYPYHYGESDVDLFVELLGEDSGVEVRRGAWY
jgi:L-ascorbate metabolism protein UlaG (beta-lactamase superfamily)